MSQWLLVRLSRVMFEVRNESLIHDGSSWDDAVHRVMDKAVERIGLTLHQANMNIDAAAFCLNAGHTGSPKF